MDPLSVIGLIIGFAAIIGGSVMEGGSPGFLLNGPAFVIVLGGTLGAILLQTPPQLFWQGLKMTAWIFSPPKLDLEREISKVVRWSVMARKEGLLGLENEIDREKDVFVRKGLQLLVDGNETEVIREALELEMMAREQHSMSAARVFEAMGGYAPTLGILGAVLGLIQVMQNLTDPGRLGQGIAIAFVATIYGVGMANLVFLPIANKLKTHVKTLGLGQELMLEGILAIAEGENPHNVELKLRGFLA